MELRVYCLVVLCFLQMKPLYGAKILGFFSTLSRSHFIVEEPVMRELAKRGHEVTVVTIFKQSGEPIENYRYIEMSEFAENEAFDRIRAEAASGNDSGFLSRFKLMEPLMRVAMDIINHQKFLPLKNETFDLLVMGWFMNDYALGLSGHFKCPSVVISPNVNAYVIRKFSGNPSSVSTIPSVFVNFNTPMTFFERLKNFGLYVAEFILFEGLAYFYIKPMYLEAFPSDKYPSYEEVVKNVSLILLAQHFSGRAPEPLLPNAIEVEGMHVKKEPSPLPKDIKEFLDKATDGAIFFSLGSNAQSSDLSQEKISILINTFRRLKQKVLWKFETDLPNIPDNVKIGKWLPQDDILAHPNVKLFISHCGKGGITEAKFHGVPILGIPLFADQFSNADHIAEEGWAVVLPMGINEETFFYALDEALYNPTYALVAKKLSNLNRDRPEHPLDKAAYWIEYVIRHNGAKHMQSPAVHLNLLQYYMVDVFAFLFVILYAVVKLLKFVFRTFLRKVFGVGRNKLKKQ